MDEEDEALWKAVARTVRPLEREDPGAEGLLRRDPVRVRPGKRHEEPVLLAKAPSALQGKALDTRTEERLRKGRMPLEGRLDLHGMTQDEAFFALIRFLVAAQERGKRCVLVITGKGKPGEGGVLRRNLPIWLEDSRIANGVLKHVPARPHHGGEGAFYVYLRRKRGENPF